MSQTLNRQEGHVIRNAMRLSLKLLTARDRRIYFIMVGVQMATSLLDLAGVLLLGVVAVMVSALAQGNPIPSPIESAATSLGLGGLDDAALIGLVGVVAAILLIIKSIVSLLLIRRVFRFLAERAATASARLSAKFFSCSLLVVQSRPSQEVAYALGQGTNAAILNVLGSGMVLISEATLLFLLGLALLYIDPFVTAAATAYFAVVAVLLQRPLSRWAGRTGETVAATDIAATTIVQEGIASYREITVLDRRDYYRQNHRRQRALSASAIADLQFVSLVPKNMMEVALILGALLLAVVQLATQESGSAFATLVIFLAAGSRVMPSLLKIQGALANLHASGFAASKTYDIAGTLEATEEPSGAASSALSIRARINEGNPDFDPVIEIESVSVSYPGAGSPALSEVSAFLGRGKSLALVGATGAGKSTLADLILGILEPDSGSVRLGGLTPRDAIRLWPGAISYVPQLVALSNGTIRENVALGLPRESIDDELVWHALSRAHLASFLKDSREGLDTVVGERGVRLSGGQRQRLGVARGLYTQPRLLVLDEATSALDAETENAIAETLQSLEGEVTTVTVAHRLATIRDADLVMYLEHGREIFSGTFDEVRTAVPRFNSQAELLGL